MDAINTIKRRVEGEMKEKDMKGEVVLPDPKIYAAPEDALLLTIYQDPGNSGAEESGQMSPKNGGGSALVMKKIYKEIDLDWGDTYTWNTIPYTKMAKATRKDVQMELGRVHDWGIIRELLGEMGKLRSVVLMGKTYAWTLEDQIRSLDEELLVLTAPHPSNLRPKWDCDRQGLIDWITRQMKKAKDHALKTEK